MEKLILNFTNEANAYEFAKLLRAGVIEAECSGNEVIFSLCVYKEDVPKENLDIYKFLSNSLLRSSNCFFYHGPEPAVSLFTISEANYEERPYFFDTLYNNLDKYTEELSKSFGIKIEGQTFGGHFGRHINFYIDLNEVPASDFVEFVKNEAYDFIYPEIYELVTADPVYHEKFKDFISYVGAGRFAYVIIETYCGQGKEKLYSDLRGKIGSAVNFFASDFEDIYYYVSCK